jgi:hypothetical protein
LPWGRPREPALQCTARGRGQAPASLAAYAPALPLRHGMGGRLLSTLQPRIPLAGLAAHHQPADFEVYPAEAVLVSLVAA